MEADIDLKVKEEKGKRDIKFDSNEPKPTGRLCKEAKVLGELKQKYVNKWLMLLLWRTCRPVQALRWQRPLDANAAAVAI